MIFFAEATASTKKIIFVFPAEITISPSEWLKKWDAEVLRQWGAEVW